MTATAGDPYGRAQGAPDERSLRWAPGSPETIPRTKRGASAAAFPRFIRAEAVVFGVIVALAVVLRLAGLGTQPLSDAEACQALVGWQLYQGQPIDQGTYSPLLATLNLIGFALLGASDFVARLGPALLGVALVVLPIGLRRQTGRIGALAASALLAVSPTALYLSRMASGDTPALVGGLAVVVGLANWLDPAAGLDARADRGRWLLLSAVGLVVMLTAAPVAYSMLALLLVFGLFVVVSRRQQVRADWTVAASLRAEWLAHRAGYMGVFLVAAAITTALFFNPGGLGAAVNLLGEWGRRFGSPAAFTYLEPRVVAPNYPAVFLMGLYDPLVLLAALFGLALVLMRRRLVDLFLVWWFFGGLVLDLLRAGRSSGQVLLPLVPAALLAGLALGSLLGSLQREGTWSREGMMVGAGCVISAYGYIQLMTYVRAGGGAVWLPLAAPAMLVILVLILWQMQDGVSAVRGAALTVVLAMVCLGVATAVRLNYATRANPAQPLAGTPAGEGIPDLLQTLQFVSIEKTRDPFLVTGLADRAVGPAVEWQLRRFPGFTWVNSADHLTRAVNDRASGNESPDAIIAPAGPGADAGYLLTDESYAGQDFVIRTSWQPTQMSPQALVRWVILRDAQPTGSDRAVLWVQQPATAVPQGDRGTTVATP
jgi:uncharacterized protein (TIGR03663 family)